jgi:hypothetical protein
VQPRPACRCPTVALPHSPLFLAPDSSWPHLSAAPALPSPVHATAPPPTPDGWGPLSATPRCRSGELCPRPPCSAPPYSPRKLTGITLPSASHHSIVSRAVIASRARPVRAHHAAGRFIHWTWPPGRTPRGYPATVRNRLPGLVGYGRGPV